MLMSEAEGCQVTIHMGQSVSRWDISPIKTSFPAFLIVAWELL